MFDEYTKNCTLECASSHWLLTFHTEEFLMHYLSFLTSVTMSAQHANNLLQDPGVYDLLPKIASVVASFFH